jgi:hypothetical protein
MAAVMIDQGETSQRVSVPEAAEILGLSVATIRRMIRAGRLQAETVRRPQGIAYVVALPGAHRDRSAGDQQVGTAARANPSAADAMAAWSSAVLAPLVETVREQAETIGSLRARLSAAEERIRMLEAPRELPSTAEGKEPEPSPVPEPLPPQPDGRPSETDAPSASVSAPWWRRWWAWGLL